MLPFQNQSLSAVLIMGSLWLPVEEVWDLVITHINVVIKTTMITVRITT